VEHYDEENSDEARADDINHLEEECLVTCVQTAKYLDGLCRYYNRNVNDRFFMVEDLVLRRKQKTECNRTDQIIRTQVQKQSLK
jgi:hypothetical protein